METWDLYDRNKKPIGRTVESGQKLGEGEYHLISEVWLIGKGGRVLVSQRHKDLRHGGLWECTGGSVLAGESSAECAVRNLRAALSIRAKKEQLRWIGTAVGGDCFVDIYALYRDVSLGGVTMNPQEVIDVKWVSAGELKVMHQCGMIVPTVWSRFSLYEDRMLFDLKYKICIPVESQAPEICRTKVYAFRLEMDLYGRNLFENYTIETERRRIRNQGGNGFIYCVMEGKKIVAGISGRRLKDGSYFIDSMYVDENHQNKGIGSHLLAFTLSQFPLETVWQADVAYKSWRSHHVYEKFAFGPIGKTRPEKDGFCYIRYRRN